MPITKQAIAIIGAGGSTGSAIAKRISGGNYRLLLFDNGISKLQTLVEEISKAHSFSDVDIRDCKHEACWEADIIILAVPYNNQKEVVERIQDVATQKIVVSTSPEASAAEELQKLLPNSKIVKIFNTDFTQEDNKGEALIAGDDEALETVAELMETAGLNPVIKGELPSSVKLENSHN